MEISKIIKEARIKKRNDSATTRRFSVCYQTDYFKMGVREKYT